MVLFLCACGADRQWQDQRTALSAAIGDCIQREAVAIAPKPVDLETATEVILARCNSHLWAEERAYIDRFPGNPAYAQEQFREMAAVRADQARREIALARTS